MDNSNVLENKKRIFGSLLLIPNKLQIIVDQALAKYDLTTKQWFLMAVIEEFFNEPPTLGEVAEVMGSSHQNAKQIALKLQQKGFLILEKDKRDGRAIRLKLTNKCFQVAEKRFEETMAFFKEFYSDFSEEELQIVNDGLNKLYGKILSIEKEMKGNKDYRL